MIVVVDASVGVKWLFPDEGRADRALDLLEAAVGGSVRLHVPRLFRTEVANAIRRKMVREGLPFARAMELLDQLRAAPVTVSEPDDLLGLAFAAACRLGLPAIYDAHYVALAEAAGGELWTDDRRLVRLVGDRSPRLRWIGDEPSRR